MAARKTDQPKQAPKLAERALEVLAARRAICALLVLKKTQMPRELRIHSHLSLGPISKAIRAEMAKDGAPDDQVEQYVAKYVQRI